jgi:hypothetical protein
VLRVGLRRLEAVGKLETSRWCAWAVGSLGKVINNLWEEAAGLLRRPGRGAPMGRLPLRLSRLLPLSCPAAHHLIPMRISHATAKA